MHSMHAHGQGRKQEHGHIQVGAAPTEGKLIRWARFYDPLVWVMSLGQIRKLRALPLRLAAIQPGERVLDVGCGTGDLTLRAARKAGPGVTTYGIDASPEMITVARRKARRSRRNVRFLVEAVEALSFPDGSFDVVLSSLMMHHLPGDLKLRALAEIRRVLRPGGRIVIVDMQPISRPLHPWQPGWLILKRHGHRRGAHTAPGAEDRTPPAALADLLRDAGFAGVESGAIRYAWFGYALGRVPE